MKKETLYRIWGYVALFLTAFVLSWLLMDVGHCQTVLMPMPRQCFPDNLRSGQPLAGGKIFTYQAGTSTPQATFTDATGLIANTNPIILDAAGCWSVWLTSGQAYRFVAQNSVGVQEWVTDQVSGLATVGSAFNQAVTTVAFSATPTFTATGQYQLFKMTLTGNVSSSTLNMAAITTPSIVSFELTQDGTGGRTFVWPLNVVGGLPLNLAANAVSTQTFFWDGNSAWPVNYPLQQSTPVTFSATPTFTATSQFQVFKMTLTGNVTSSTLSMTGLNPPAYVTFQLTQDATGGRTFAAPSNVTGFVPINSTLNSTSVQTFFWDGTTAWAWQNPPLITANSTYTGNNTFPATTFTGTITAPSLVSAAGTSLTVSATAPASAGAGTSATFSAGNAVGPGTFAGGTLTLNAGTGNGAAPPVAPIQTNSFFRTYQGITTYGPGIASEVAGVELSSQNAAITTTTLYTTPVSVFQPTQYRLSWNAKVTTAAGASSTLGALTVTYVDQDGITQTITAGALSKTGTLETTDTLNSNTTVLLGLPITLNCNFNTNITYAFAYLSNPAAAMLYNLHIRLEAM